MVRTVLAGLVISGMAACALAGTTATIVERTEMGWRYQWALNSTENGFNGFLVEAPSEVRVLSYSVPMANGWGAGAHWYLAITGKGLWIDGKEVVPAPPDGWKYLVFWGAGEESTITPGVTAWFMAEIAGESAPGDVAYAQVSLEKGGYTTAYNTTVGPATVSEPGSLAALTAPLGMLVFRRRRR